MSHSEKPSGIEGVKKWLGLAAAVISLSSVIYGYLHAAADRRERDQTVTEKLAAGHLQQQAGDYAQAWASFEEAAKVAGKDGMLAKLFGGLSKRQEEAHTALEELAMQWVRDAHNGDGSGFSDAGNNAIKVLAADVEEATGAHKADMLAHLGWAYFLKGRNQEAVAQPLPLYKQAVSADPQNPYANAFWGHLILWNHGSVAEAKQHFAAALSSGRERGVVEHFELAAFGNVHSDEADAAWWQVVDRMHKAGEALDADTLRGMGSRYYQATSDEDDLKNLLAAVPPVDTVELARLLLKQPDDAGSGRLPVKVALAESLEAAGRNDEALAAWQDLQAATHGQPTSFDERMKAAMKRLGGAKPH